MLTKLKQGPIIYYDNSHIVQGKFSYSLDGLSTCWFSCSTEVELWLFMLRLGFSGCLAGFTGGTGKGSSSYTQLDLVSLGGCDLFGVVPLLCKVSSSALMDRPTGFFGGWGLGADAGGLSICETFWLSLSTLWWNWGLRATEGLAATGGLFVIFLGSGSGLAGSVASAGPPWLSKAWIRAWILRWLLLISPPASSPPVTLFAASLFSTRSFPRLNTSSSLFKYLFEVDSPGSEETVSGFLSSWTKTWPSFSSAVGCFRCFERGSGTGTWRCSGCEDVSGATAHKGSLIRFQCTVTDLVHAGESDRWCWSLSNWTPLGSFVSNFSSVGAAISGLGFLTADFGSDGLGGFLGFLPGKMRTEL